MGTPTCSYINLACDSSLFFIESSPRRLIFGVSYHVVLWDYFLSGNLEPITAQGDRISLAQDRTDIPRSAAARTADTSLHGYFCVR